MNISKLLGNSLALVATLLLLAACGHDSNTAGTPASQTTSAVVVSVIMTQ